MAEWTGINEELKYRLKANSPAKHITTEEEFIQQVNDVVRITYRVLQELIDKKLPNPYKQHWWTKELTNLKKVQNQLSNRSHKFRHIHEHPSHAEYRAAANKFKEVMTDTRNQDWTDLLEGASQRDLFLANKYISNGPTDYLNARIPPLRTQTNGLPDIAENNDQKVKALAESFFPPPPEISYVVVRDICFQLELPFLAILFPSMENIFCSVFGGGLFNSLKVDR